MFIPSTIQLQLLSARAQPRTRHDESVNVPDSRPLLALLASSSERSGHADRGAAQPGRLELLRSTRSPR